jgi:hypothetical protein
MAAFVWISHPFPPIAAWKGWVRIALLCLGACCAVINAAASSIDVVGTSSGAGLTAFVSGGSFVLFIGCCGVGGLLVAGFLGTVVVHARSEKLQRETDGAAYAARTLRGSWRASADQRAGSQSSVHFRPAHSSIAELVMQPRSLTAPFIRTFMPGVVSHPRNGVTSVFFASRATTSGCSQGSVEQRRSTPTALFSDNPLRRVAPRRTSTLAVALTSSTAVTAHTGRALMHGSVGADAQRRGIECDAQADERLQKLPHMTL